MVAKLNEIARIRFSQDARIAQERHHHGDIVMIEMLGEGPCNRTSLLWQQGIVIAFAFAAVHHPIRDGDEFAMLAASRRCFRVPDAPPLAPIRSMHCFVPVIEEVLINPLDDSYVEYLKSKLMKWVVNPPLS
jgi:hypothetical protein